MRRKLPDTRRSITHHVEIVDPASGEFDLYIITGLYEDGKPGELFLHMGKLGSTVNGLLDVIGILTSIGLQYGVDVEALSRKLSKTSFVPYGTTSNPAIPTCTSIADYVFQWLSSLASQKVVQVEVEVELPVRRSRRRKSK